MYFDEEDFYEILSVNFNFYSDLVSFNYHFTYSIFLTLLYLKKHLLIVLCNGDVFSLT